MKKTLKCSDVENSKQISYDIISVLLKIYLNGSYHRSVIRSIFIIYYGLLQHIKN